MNCKHAAAGFLLLLTVAGSLSSCASPAPRRTDHAVSIQPQSRPKLSTALLEKRIHALINTERTRKGLPALRWDDALAGIARKHSGDMAIRNYFEHTSPDGHGFMHRYSQGGYSCSVRAGNRFFVGAENIFQNVLYNSARTVNGTVSYDWNSLEKIATTTVNGWMKSPGHRQNILTPSWGRQGIGIVIAPNDKIYITQNFC